MQSSAALVPLVAAALLISPISSSAQGPELGLRRRMVPASVGAKELLELTGDGRLDLVTGGWDKLQVWRGEADGAFREEHWAYAPGDDAGLVDYAFADVDADADQDLIIARTGICVTFSCLDAQDELYLNDGSGIFTQASGLPASASHASSRIEAGDVDADGDLDLVLGGHELCWKDFWGIDQCHTSDTLVWKNDGAGTFTAFAGAHLADHRFTLMLLADFSGDGAVELFARSDDLYAQSYENLFYRNDGAGHFALDLASISGQPSPPLAKASAADLDLDGDLDLVANYHIYWETQAEEDTRIFRNDGTGKLAWDPGELAGFRSWTHAILDLDGDDDPDLLLGHGSGGGRYANDGAGHFTALGPFTGPVAGAGFTGDVDQDGDGDVLFGARLYLGDGQGEFAEATVPLPSPDVYEGWNETVALLDLEQDGDLDAAVANPAGANDLYGNDGAGHLAAVEGGAWTASGERGLVLASDLDGDGDEDLVAGAAPPEPSAELFHNVAGAFPAQIQLAGTTDVRAAVAADFDLDGDLDLAFAREPLNQLLRNDLGAFTPVPGAFPPAGDSRSLAAVDHDQDGDLDLVQGMEIVDVLFRNDGGTFALEAGALPANEETLDWAVDDVDLDGDLDLMTGTLTEASNRLYLSTGAGFVDAPAGQIPPLPAEEVALADFDLDGDPDALWLGVTHQLLLANDGAGAFSEVSDLSSLASQGPMAAIGDLDGDLDPDALVVGGVEHHLLLSLHRQLAWRAPPRLGKPLSFELDGTPGALYVQVWSTGTAAIPLAPFGVLRLDPAHLFLVASGILDGAGHAVVETSVPPTPSLLGANLATQALIGDPLRFSNLETLALTGF